MKVDMFPGEAEGQDSYYPCHYHIDFHVGVFEILLPAFISNYTEMSRFLTSYGATDRCSLSYNMRELHTTYLLLT